MLGFLKLISGCALFDPRQFHSRGIFENGRR
jgi:hypothetical protein